MKRIIEKFNSLKLNTKFSLVVILLIAIPMLIFVFMFFKFTKQGMMYQVMNDLNSSMAAETEQIEKITELCSMTSQVFLGDEQLQDFLTDLSQEKEISQQDYYDFFKNNISLYEGMINSNPYIEHIHVYADNNEFPEMMPVLFHKDRLNSDIWNEENLSGKWFQNYEDLISGTNAEVVSVVSHIRNVYGEKVGLLEVSVKKEEMFSGIFSSTAEEWKCFIPDDGQIIKGKENSFSDLEPELNKFLEGTEIGNGYRNKLLKANGHEYLLSVQRIEALSGNYVYAVNADEKLETISTRQVQVLLSMMLLFAAMIILINLTVNRLLKKFYETIKVVQTIRDGNMETRIPNLGTDEIGDLSRQINKMLDRIQDLMKENIDREVLIKNTEIKALQNQINSHFIYNVLESIKMMAEIDEEYLISDAVTSLGELLRYNMKWVAHNVTVRDEINYIKNYIQLMNLRYDFEILLNIKIEQKIYEQEIPKMSLQPIVENAICHGIVENAEDAVIYIKAVSYPERFEISITDSGTGMTEEQLSKLEQKVQGKIETSGGAGNGIGLKNVQDRIRMQFGEPYGLKFYSKEGCYTKVCVILPLKQGGQYEKLTDC